MVKTSDGLPIDLLRQDVVCISRELIGYELHTFIHG